MKESCGKIADDDGLREMMKKNGREGEMEGGVLRCLCRRREKRRAGGGLIPIAAAEANFLLAWLAAKWRRL